MTKVIVTKEVAEAIEDLRKVQYTNSKIIADIENDRGCTAYGTLMPTLIKFSRQSEGNLDILMKALVNGYEIEKSPEENVFDYYNRMRLRRNGILMGYEREGLEIRMQTVQETLDILGIKIEGINNYAQNTQTI